jgi:hypothetical protein
VAGQISFIRVAVRLCFNNYAGDAFSIERTNKQPAEKVFRNLPRGTAVEGTCQTPLHLETIYGQFALLIGCHVAGSLLKATPGQVATFEPDCA